jgi:hypothetical protein
VRQSYAPIIGMAVGTCVALAAAVKWLRDGRLRTRGGGEIVRRWEPARYWFAVVLAMLITGSLLVVAILQWAKGGAWGK